MTNENVPKQGIDDETIAAYNNSAEALEKRYTSMGARIEDIERGLEFSESSEPFVVEIGCGDGRDAVEILERVGRYIGVDVSEEMLKLARKKLPEGTELVEADVVNYEFPKEVDVVFAFASLLHLNRVQMQGVLKKAEQALNQGGVFYLSLKRRNVYSDNVETNEFGSRHFYYYSKEDIQEIKPQTLEEVYYSEQHHGDNDWMTIVFKKS